MNTDDAETTEPATSGRYSASASPSDTDRQVGEKGRQSMQ